MEYCSQGAIPWCPIIIIIIAIDCAAINSAQSIVAQIIYILTETSYNQTGEVFQTILSMIYTFFYHFETKSLSILYKFKYFAISQIVICTLSHPSYFFSKIDNTIVSENA